jgi:hypothetical protein
MSQYEKGNFIKARFLIVFERFCLALFLLLIMANEEYNERNNPENKPNTGKSCLLQWSYFK